MRTRFLAVVAGGIALAVMVRSAGAQASSLPPGFKEDIAVSGLARPTAMAFAPDGRLFICQQEGKVRVFHNGQLTDFVTLNVSSNSERGVLGIAFDPLFRINGYVYLYYTTNADSLDPPSTPKNRVSRFTALGDAAAAGSETILLDNIPSDAGNHNGGCLRIGQDGKLYIATGDGGSNHQNSQNLGNLAGKILRINLDGSIPNDNPFANQMGKRGEIYCYGLRNPFRFNFRPGTNTLYIGDVGEVTWEEIDVGQPGGNYGWPNSEGPDNVSGYIAPIYYYNHNNQSAAITGGCFIEGKNYPPSYRGSYFFGDYVNGFLRRLVVTADNKLVQAFDFGPVNSPVDFAQGPDGDLYYVSILSGTVRRIRYVGRGLRGARQPIGGIGTPRPH